MQASSWESQGDLGLLQESSPPRPPDSLSVRLGLLLNICKWQVSFEALDIHKLLLKMVQSDGGASVYDRGSLIHAPVSQTQRSGFPGEGKQKLDF